MTKLSEHFQTLEMFKKPHIYRVFNMCKQIFSESRRHRKNPKYIWYQIICKKTTVIWACNAFIAFQYSCPQCGLKRHGNRTPLFFSKKSIVMTISDLCAISMKLKISAKIEKEIDVKEKKDFHSVKIVPICFT